jgi:hypothetical protein
MFVCNVYIWYLLYFYTPSEKGIMEENNLLNVEMKRAEITAKGKF